jgi:hypothetical protein
VVVGLEAGGLDRDAAVGTGAIAVHVVPLYLQIGLSSRANMPLCDHRHATPP